MRNPKSKKKGSNFEKKEKRGTKSEECWYASIY